MRHSIPNKNIGNNETHPLSNEGIEKAKQFYKKEVFRNINKVISSPYLRTIQTAYLYSDEIVKDDHLIERLIGDLKTAHKSQWKKQYDDYDYKNTNGESLNEVKHRMSECIQEYLYQMHENKKILIISHATSICSYLLNFCEIQVTDEYNKIRRITYNGEIVLEGRIQTPSCFILKFENNYIKSIDYIQ